MRTNIIATLFLLLWSIVPAHVFPQSTSSVEGDREALMDLYEATGGNSWNNNS